MLEVRPARIEDACALAPRLRLADRNEILAVRGIDPVLVLREGITGSDPCYAVVDGVGRLIALFGAGPDPNRKEAGIVWLLATPDLASQALPFLRNSRKWVDRLHLRYRILGNWVDARNAVHIHWLKWCGFTLVRKVDQFGVEKRPFVEFTRVRRDDAVGSVISQQAFPGGVLTSRG